MIIKLRACEIDLSRNIITVIIEKDGQIYKQERRWIEEATGNNPYVAVSNIRYMLSDIFESMY